MEAASNRPAVSAKRLRKSLAIRQRRQNRARPCLRNESTRRSARWWRWRTTTVCVLLEFADRRALERELSILRAKLKTNVVPGEHRHLDAVRSQLADYFSGKKLEFDIPLAAIGSDFQMRAWKVLRSIPIGETRSYSWMAKRLGDEGARRAVGRANGTNMICIIVPCHRVIRADGTLCGYGGGLWRKKWLLDHEQKWKKASA